LILKDRHPHYAVLIAIYTVCDLLMSHWSQHWWC